MHLDDCSPSRGPAAGATGFSPPTAPFPALPRHHLVPQIVLVFYMYHVDENMMGRAAGRQYPQMLARHYAARLRLPAATVVVASQVGPCWRGCLALAGLAGCG